MAIRITYNSVNVDLQIAENSLEVEHVQEYSQNKSGSGKTEQINQYGAYIITFDAYFQVAVERQLQAWWSWARQGKEFSFAMDSGNIGSTTLDASAAAGQKNVPLLSTTGFTAADECLIKANDVDDEFEIVIIASVDSGVKVVATDNLIFSYNSADTFRHRHYWPTLKTLDKKFKPDRDGNWYRWKFSFAEVL